MKRDLDVNENLCFKGNNITVASGKAFTALLGIPTMVGKWFQPAFHFKNIIFWPNYMIVEQTTVHRQIITIPVSIISFWVGSLHCEWCNGPKARPDNHSSPQSSDNEPADRKQYNKESRNWLKLDAFGNHLVAMVYQTIRSRGWTNDRSPTPSSRSTEGRPKWARMWYSRIP